MGLVQTSNVISRGARHCSLLKSLHIPLSRNTSGLPLLPFSSLAVPSSMIMVCIFIYSTPRSISHSFEIPWSSYLFRRHNQPRKRELFQTEPTGSGLVEIPAVSDHNTYLAEDFLRDEAFLPTHEHPPRPTDYYDIDCDVSHVCMLFRPRRPDQHYLGT